MMRKLSEDAAKKLLEKDHNGQFWNAVDLVGYKFVYI
jgi:hypothetical protein